MRPLVGINILLLCSLAVSAQPLRDASSTSVALYRNLATAAEAALVGAGIDLPGGARSRPAHDRDGRPVEWRLGRSVIDPRGGQHRFYRQHVRSEYGTTELFGSEVALHYNAAGQLWSISGRQFETVIITNHPRFSALEAVDRALARAQSYPNFRAQRPATVSPAERAYRAEHTQLRLVQRADVFRYAYFTLINDEHGVVHDIILDAQTEEIFGVIPANPSSNCNPTSPWESASATGVPVRASGQRSLQANVANNREPSWITHEGFYWTSPLMSVLQETSDPIFRCQSSAYYTVFPLQTNSSGVPVYENNGVWAGRAAGDALFHTKKTMDGLAFLGRSSWDGAGGDANIVVQSTYYPDTYDNAAFINQAGGHLLLPPTKSVIISPAQAAYNLAAALDVIAHEWGHGVVFTTANFEGTVTGGELHEGFADVIGHTIEKLQQPTGTGLEQSSDWEIAEDALINDTYFRSAAQDDGFDGHHWDGPNGSSDPLNPPNDFFHKQDEEPTHTNHGRGNMLAVAFRLLTEGGTNPVCNLQPTLSGV